MITAHGQKTALKILTQSSFLAGCHQHVQLFLRTLTSGATGKVPQVNAKPKWLAINALSVCCSEIDDRPINVIVVLIDAKFDTLGNVDANFMVLPQTGATESVHSPGQLLYNRFSHTWSPCQGTQMVGTQLKQNGALHAVLLARWFSGSKLKPKHVGGKLKVYSSFKERFKLTGTGRVKYMPPGHRHRRSRKSADQNRQLRKSSMLFSTYAKTMKKLGFRMTSY